MSTLPVLLNKPTAGSWQLSCLETSKAVCAAVKAERKGLDSQLDSHEAASIRAALLKLTLTLPPRP